MAWVLVQDNVLALMEEMMLVLFLVDGFMTVQLSLAQWQIEGSTCGVYMGLR